MNIPAIEHPVTMPELNEDDLKEAGAALVKSEKALLVAGGLICTTGGGGTHNSI